MPGGIKSERWARSFRNGGRHRAESALKKERPKTRVLSEAKIKVLWHGLDRNDLPWDRTTRLAIRFALATMLRSNELLPIHRSELDIKGGVANIPARRVKKRRLIRQPLSDLALEIINDSMGDNKFAFRQPVRRRAAFASSDVGRALRHQEDPRHLRIARHEAVHAA